MITYDVRGHGKSSRSESYDLKDHVEDLRYLMDALNVSSAHILGHDMGASLVENLQKHINTKDFIKLCYITHGFTKLMVDNQEEVAGFNKSEAMIILFPKLFHNQDKAMRWYQRQKLYSRPTPEDSAIAIRALLNSVDVTKDVHNKVTVPTFIVNGEHDPLIFDKQHYRIDNYFENVRKSIFSGSGHAPHIEEPERF